MSLFSFKKKPSLSFVFNIRDTSMSVAVVRLEDDMKPEMVLCQSFEIPNADKNDYSKYVTSMAKTVDTAILSIRSGLVKIGNHEQIEKYYFFIGSPWSISQTKTIKIIKEKSFEITNKFLENIFASQNEASEKQFETINQETDWKVYEEKIIQAKLNGYVISNVLHKKTKDADIDIFVSFMPANIKNKIIASLGEKFIRSYVSNFNSCALSSYTFLRDLYPDKNDFIYIDIGDIITDIYIVRDDIITCISSFPFGEKDMLKSITETSNVPESVLLSTLQIHYDEHANETVQNDMEKVIASGVEIWTEKLNEFISKMCIQVDMPKNIFMMTTNVLSNLLIQEIIKKNEANTIRISDVKMEITNIAESVLNDLVTNGKVFMNESYIKADIIFLDKMLKNSLNKK